MSIISWLDETTIEPFGSPTYFLGADGNLMPSKKDQAPPDLRYFKQSHK
jgi:hypothetical protein